MTAAHSVYKHILLATDLSTHCEFVGKRAAEMAKLTHASLSVVHVQAHTPIAYAGEFSIPIDAESELVMRQHVQKKLAHLSSKFHIPEDQQYIIDGSIKTEIALLAKKIHADLLVIGTHSHEGLELLLGSQANAIVHAAPCDVHVVRIK